MSQNSLSAEGWNTKSKPIVDDEHETCDDTSRQQGFVKVPIEKSACLWKRKKSILAYEDVRNSFIAKFVSVCFEMVRNVFTVKKSSVFYEVGCRLLCFFDLTVPRIMWATGAERDRSNAETRWNESGGKKCFVKKKDLNILLVHFQLTIFIQFFDAACKYIFSDNIQQFTFARHQKCISVQNVGWIFFPLRFYYQSRFNLSICF